MTHKPRLHDKTADNCNNSHYELYGLGDCVNIRASLQLSVLTSLAHFADQLKFTSPAFNRLLLTALPLEFPSKKGEKKANTTFQYIAD